MQTKQPLQDLSMHDKRDFTCVHSTMHTHMTALRRALSHVCFLSAALAGTAAYFPGHALNNT